MGTINVSASWTGKALHYVGTDSKGNQIQMGGENVSPTQMLLLGAAGCMGMDVVSVLQKKRQAVTGVEVQVTGHQPDEYPKPFHTIELTFIVKGNNVDPQAVARAIELSRDKYCIVGQTLQNKTELKTSFTVEPG
ncbi:MAG: OsmC family protein [Anaerolineae bacterium]|nr:OsmC family protein [Anaerolineae bacterium]